MTGTITSGSTWITAEPSSFSLDSNISQTITLTMLGQSKDVQSGIITIKSNTIPAQDIEIPIELAVTCILAKPNPVLLGQSVSRGQSLVTFYGDGIVSKNTKIVIYAFSGDKIKVLKSNDSNEITWDGRNEQGKLVADGIYIYTYESPKEKGVGKITIIK